MTKLVLTTVLFVFCQISQLWAQEEIREIKVSGSFQHFPVKQFFQQLEDQHAIHFYYQDEWIDTMVVNNAFDEIPLVQVLNKLFGQGRISYRFFQNSVVLFPRESISGNSLKPEESTVLYIGDQINIGRYKTAVIRGTVTDGKTGDRLPGAIVYVSDLDKGITTNARGEFEIELPTGRHHLQISYVGFEPVQQDIELIEDGSVVFDLFEETHK